MSFKISARYKQAAQVVNQIPHDKLALLLTSIFKKLHLKSTKLFGEEEETQLRNLFSFSEDDLHLVLDCCCYTFEQAAFTSTGPEILFDILLSAGFAEAHAKIIGRTWATEATEYIAKLKDQSLGYRYLSNVDYHLNMVTGQSELTRQQETCAIFELTVQNSLTDASQAEKLQLEFNHEELYSFFNDLERMQQQLDRLSKS